MKQFQAFLCVLGTLLCFYGIILIGQLPYNGPKTNKGIKIKTNYTDTLTIQHKEWIK